MRSENRSPSRVEAHILLDRESLKDLRPTLLTFSLPHFLTTLRHQYLSLTTRVFEICGTKMMNIVSNSSSRMVTLSPLKPSTS